MFKNRILIVIAVFLLIFGTATIATYSGYRNSRAANMKKDAEIDNYGMYINKRAKGARNIVYSDERVKLKYDRSENLSSRKPEDRSDAYGSYDVYVDDNGNEFYYLQNTDMLCGVKNKKIDGERLTPFDNDDEAIKIAEEFMIKIFGSDHDYDFESCKIPPQRFYYEVIYRKYVNGYKTDDYVRLWVNFDGEVCAFSAFNRDRYDHIAINRPSAIASQQRSKSNIVDTLNSENFTIVDQYISKNEEGKLVMVSVIEYSLTDGVSVYPIKDEVSVVIE